MVIQNHALPDSDQNGNSCYRSLKHRYFISNENAVFSILCSYFFNKKVVIVIAAGEKGGHHKKVILSSKSKNYAPVFLPFFGNIFLIFFWWKNPFFLFFWPTYVLGTLKRSRSKVKVTEVTTQLNRFRTVTPVWIHIWWWNDTYSLMLLRRGALLFLKVIRQISRSHGAKNRQIWPRLGVSGL